jgi:hypothetical protein
VQDKVCVRVRIAVAYPHLPRVFKKISTAFECGWWMAVVFFRKTLSFLHSSNGWSLRVIWAGRSRASSNGFSLFSDNFFSSPLKFKQNGSINRTVNRKCNS